MSIIGMYINSGPKYDIEEELVRSNDPDVTTCAIQNLTWNRDRIILKKVLVCKNLQYSLERRDNTGYTPLMAAVNLADFEIAEALLEAKANANVCDETQRSVIQLCALRCPRDRDKLCRLLQKYGGKFCHPVFEAAYKGDLSTISDAFSNTEKLTPRKDCSGHTVLHYAAANGHLDYVKGVVAKSKEAISVVSNNGDSALLLAAKNGHRECLQHLMENASKEVIGLTDKFGRDILMCASRFGHTGVVKWLHEGKAILNRQSPQDAESPLTCAAYGGHVECIEYLLSQGAYHDDSVRIGKMVIPPLTQPPIFHVVQPNKSNRTAVSPVHDDTNDDKAEEQDDVVVSQEEARKLRESESSEAKECDKKEIVVGTEPEAKDKTSSSSSSTDNVDAKKKKNNDQCQEDSVARWGLMPLLFYALEKSELKISKWLHNHGCSWDNNLTRQLRHTAFMRAAVGGSLKCLHWVARHCHDSVSATTIDGCSALHYAVVNDNLRVARELVAMGGADSADAGGNTLILSAAKEGSLWCLQWLLDRNPASIEQRNTSGQTPLLVAIAGSQHHTAEWLVKKKADVNAKDINGHGVVLMAAKAGSSKILRWLLDNRLGGGVSVRDSVGRTPLMLAASCNHLEAVELLIERKAAIGAMSICNLTPLLWASWLGCESVVKCLLDNKANINDLSLAGESCLHLAAKCSHSHMSLDTAKLLVERGNDPVIKDCQGKTPSYVASTYGNLGMLKWLFENGHASAIETDDKGTPVLFATCESTHLCTVKALVENKAPLVINSKLLMKNKSKQHQRDGKMGKCGSSVSNHINNRGGGVSDDEEKDEEEEDDKTVQEGGDGKFDAALFHAVAYKRTKIVRYLLQAGDNPHLESMAYKNAIDEVTRATIDNSLQKRTLKALLVLQHDLGLLSHLLKIVAGYASYAGSNAAIIAAKEEEEDNVDTSKSSSSASSSSSCSSSLSCGEDNSTYELMN
mmetsp:Transcript_30855/g.52232  ORF Transcript_30855/g.52232 Transcript_30855/m.52232 type:complete len:970 (+) Transcript_30855:125-3034(+)